MNNNYIIDRGLEDKFSNTIKQILGLFFIKKDILKDLNEGCDFQIYTIHPFKVAVRLRRYAYIKFSDEFTIRWHRPFNTKTEIHKIKEKLVHYFLYGFIDKDQQNIIKYFIADLNIFTSCYKDPIFIMKNQPRDSDFAIWKINQFPSEFILHKYQR